MTKYKWELFLDQTLSVFSVLTLNFWAKFVYSGHCTYAPFLAKKTTLLEEAQ